MKISITKVIEFTGKDSGSVDSCFLDRLWKSLAVTGALGNIPKRKGVK